MCQVHQAAGSSGLCFRAVEKVQGTGKLELGWLQLGAGVELGGRFSNARTCKEQLRGSREQHGHLLVAQHAWLPRSQLSLVLLRVGNPLGC